MALILELGPEVEARIRIKAAVRGQKIEEYLLTLAENDPAIDLTEFKDRNDFEESVAAIREGLADLEAGRTYSMEEMSAFLEEQKAVWRKEKEERNK